MDRRSRYSAALAFPPDIFLCFGSGVGSRKWENFSLSHLYSVLYATTLGGASVSASVYFSLQNILLISATLLIFCFRVLGMEPPTLSFQEIFQNRQHILGKSSLYLESTLYVSWACISSSLGTLVCEVLCTIRLCHRSPMSFDFLIFVGHNFFPGGSIGVRLKSNAFYIMF